MIVYEDQVPRQVEIPSITFAWGAPLKYRNRGFFMDCACYYVVFLRGRPENKLQVAWQWWPLPLSLRQWRGGDGM